MVGGMESFREWFRGYEDQYAIIGGTACDLLMTDEGLDFRATKDIDLVVIQTDDAIACLADINLGNVVFNVLADEMVDTWTIDARNFLCFRK